MEIIIMIPDDNTCMITEALMDENYASRMENALSVHYLLIVVVKEYSERYGS